MSPKRPSGRPPEMKHRVKFLLPLEGEELDEIRRRAEEAGIPVAHWIRRSLHRVLAEEGRGGREKGPPQRLLAAELAKVGVWVRARKPLRLQCIQCGSVWTPEARDGTRLPRGYWKCPEGCNRP